MIPEEDRSLEKIFMEIGSHYKAKIFKRYLFTAMYFENKYFINFDKYLDDKEKNNKVIKYKDKIEKELNDYSMKKLIPVTMPIKDIIKKIKAKRFIVRPKYQRSEVKNQNLASYLLESILLGIKIPSIYVYKHNDENNTIEVIDGQQRILSVLAFLGEKYLDSNYQEIQTIKNKFKLKNLLKD